MRAVAPINRSPRSALLVLAVVALAGCTGGRGSGSQEDVLQRPSPRAIPTPVPSLTAVQAEFVASCVGQEDARFAAEFVGRTEDQAVVVNSQNTTPFRLVARDGVCLPRPESPEPEWVNLIVENGKIIWAGRF
jgi:hypothetical protein